MFFRLFVSPFPRVKFSFSGYLSNLRNTPPSRYCLSLLLLSRSLQHFPFLVSFPVTFCPPRYRRYLEGQVLIFSCLFMSQLVFFFFFVSSRECVLVRVLHHARECFFPLANLLTSVFQLLHSHVFVYYLPSRLCLCNHERTRGRKTTPDKRNKHESLVKETRLIFRSISWAPTSPNSATQ